MTDRAKKKEFQVIRVVTASEMPPERVNLIAQRFAEFFKITSYTSSHEVDKDLIGGFIIFAAGYRYDYSVRGQLERIGHHLKSTHHFSSETVSGDDAPAIESEQIRESIDQALASFDESPTALYGQDLLFDQDGKSACLSDAQSAKLLVDQLREQAASAFSEATTVEEIGYVLQVGDGVAFVKGMQNCLTNELIMFTPSIFGIAMNLEEERVGVVVLGDERYIREGSICKRTGRTISVTVGRKLLGRVVDPLGNPIDGKGPIRSSACRPIESGAPSIIDRSPVNVSLATGITAIDALTPIGRGQRELIIGDRQTGKTAIAIDTIINQKGKNVLCVYVAIGQKMANIVQTVGVLEQNHALDYTVIVAAGAADQASLQYIAPFSGCAIAEYFMYEEHEDVLIVFDDLTRHAQAYRSISLLLRRPPGREAFPGDVFYLHSRLLERAAKLSKEKGGGSITALPIIETLAGDISAYIPTNVISITDGQIYLESELFFSGQRPAINVGLSVSRVGGAAQTKAMKKVAGPLRINLAQAREMAAFAQFGSDLDENTRKQLKRGIVLNEVLKQEQYAPLSMAEQVISLFLATGDYVEIVEKEDVKDFVSDYIEKIRTIYPEVITEIENTSMLSDEVAETLKRVANEQADGYTADRPDYLETER